jgi:hypothetical protein
MIAGNAHPITHNDPPPGDFAGMAGRLVNRLRLSHQEAPAIMLSPKDPPIVAGTVNDAKITGDPIGDFADIDIGAGCGLNRGHDALRDFAMNSHFKASTSLMGAPQTGMITHPHAGH